MQKIQINFTLTSPARGSGGDRYEAYLPNSKKPWVIYVDQSISRQGSSKPAGFLSITVEEPLG